MSTALIHCPKCKAALLEHPFNAGEFAPCASCQSPLQIEIFPALFRRIDIGRTGEAIMMEGEASCFYHAQKKAVLPCELCGRFLCSLCDCDFKGQHLCPSCLESGKKKQTISGLENVRVLYQRQALLLALLPFLITGVAAIFLSIKYWKTPDSLVSPKRWAMPVALVFGILQAIGLVLLIIGLFTAG